MENKQNKTFLCIIPARGGSKGIPNKNLIDINGKPLISYTIEAAKKSNIFDKIIVTTDSFQIAGVALYYGASVPFMRPPELATDESLVQDAVVHTLKYLEKLGESYDYVCLFQPTAPLVLPEDFHNMISLLSSKKADMIISVCPCPCNINWVDTLPPDHSMKDFGPGPVCGTRRQQFQDNYLLNGAIYLGKWDIFYHKKEYYKQNSYAYIMPTERSIDIDTFSDIKIVRLLLKEQNEKS